MMLLTMSLAMALPADPGTPDPETVSADPGQRREEQWQVRGLRQPGEIKVDRWGLPHLYAASVRDAYFLQGYNAARDRLWQIDLWRKRGLGLLSASFGADYVRQDRAARLFLYRGSMAAEWARYAAGSRDNYSAFAAGINAYVDEVRAGRKPLPREFALTRSLPDHWRAEDLVRIRSGTLVVNAKQEALRAQTACAGGIAADRLRVRLYPDHEVRIPAGLDPCSVTPEVMADYVLATSEVSFAPEQKSASAALVEAAENSRMEGSNNWVIAASRSATGRPILANDPHRALSVPSLRYMVHLDAPGLSLIGGGEPSSPGVTIGHNGTAAFGLTIFAADQEDIYVYDLKPGDPGVYRYRGRWERMRTVREVIAVKGAAPVPVELQFTRHGPVLYRDPGQHRAFALRTVWALPGASGYAAASWLATAKRWSDFRAAANHWGTPPLNLIWADTSGTTGWIAAAMVPVRPNWDGLLPVPGDGRYEWKGLLRPSALPQMRDPAKGWFASANEMNLPRGYPADVPIGFEWGEPSRVERIAEVIAGKPRFSIADATALQTDTHSNLAPRLVALAASLRETDPQARRALALLRAWDFNLTVDSVPATIFETWATQHLGRVLAAHAAPEAAAAIGPGSADAALRVLETRDPLLGRDPERVIQAVLSESLAAALADLRGRLGPSIDSWRWGRLHGITLRPAVSPLADPALQRAMTVGPVEIGGSGSTPAMALYRGSNFTTVHGPSVRMVIDVGDWDRSRFVNMPGQSGDVDDAHYRDLFPLWAKGDYAPLAFSRAAVDQATTHVIRLEPAR